MQFELNGALAPFEKIQEFFPIEANILKNCQNIDWRFSIEGELWKLVEPPYKPIFIDIPKTLRSHEITFFKSSPYKESIARAIGLKAGKDKPRVFDATGGLLGDSLLMYSLGTKSISVAERHPLAACLISNALRNNKISIDFYHSDAKQVEGNFDVVFYDPMYSGKNTKAAPKKEMAVFRKWVGEDSDALEVAQSLKSRSKSRLVIKRSVKAEPLLPNPSLQFKGKSTRYDVYLSI